MELVYLWVEEYKNIEKQGFNFSPRFECIFYDEYEEDENGNKKLKDGCKLKIVEKIKKEDYVSIFPDNINVTAIVGENGSGKSRLFEIISKLRFERLAHEKTKIILVYLGIDGFEIILNTKSSYHSFETLSQKQIINNTEYSIVTNQKLFWLSYFSNNMSDFTDEENIYKDSSHYDCFYNGCDSDISFESKFAYLVKKKNNIFSLLNKSYIFNLMQIELNFKDLNLRFSHRENKYEKINYELESFFQNNIDTNGGFFGKPSYELMKEDYIYNFLASFYLGEYIAVVENFLTEFLPEYADEIDKIYIESFLQEKILPLVKEYKKNTTSKDINEKIIDKIYKYYHKFKEFIYKEFKEEQGQLDHFDGYAKELSKISEYKQYVKELISNFDLDKKSKLLVSKRDKILEENVKKFFDFFDANILFKYLHYSNKLYLNFFNDKTDVNYKDLSTGEKQYLRFFVNYLYTLILRKENRVYFFDEVDMSLHPQWQKELFDKMLTYIMYLKSEKIIKNQQYNFLIASHSPFLLSDLPKENVIFLEKDADGKCKNVTKTTDIETFGANIHTLLSHGFFMDGGLMGEFAKGKIENIREFYKKVEEESSKEKSDFSTLKIKYEKKKIGFWHIHSIVGEPFLKTIVKNQLEEIELILLGKNEAIDNEIARLQALKESVSDKA